MHAELNDRRGGGGLCERGVHANLGALRAE